MSATTTGRGVNFGGILYSEWIKLVSLRSTFWCFGILIFITVAMGFLFSIAFSETDVPSMSYEDSQQLAAQAATASIRFSQLVIVVLGALIITGEYGTGMIRSTLTAVPTRIPALLGKVVVFGVLTFVVSFIAIAGAAVMTAPLFEDANIPVDLSDPAYWQALLGAAGYLALSGLFATAIGTMVRNGAGAIALVLGLILVLPTIVTIFAALLQEEWIATLNTLLPSNVGLSMYSYPIERTADPFGMDGLVLDPVQGGLALLGYVVALLVIASVLLKRRDA